MEHEHAFLSQTSASCLSCRQPSGQSHEEGCMQAEHEAMLAGEEQATLDHDPAECWHCSREEVVTTICQCGDCCRRLIIEVCAEDGEVEPKIKERCSPIYSHPDEFPGGQPVLQGYLLNSPENNFACTFLDQATSLCSIYSTRPLLCRMFDCDGENRDDLIELGILPPRTGK